MSQRDPEPLNAAARAIDARSIAAMLFGWGVLTLAAFSLTDVFSATFLGAPIGVYIAGQGALLSLVIFGLTVSRSLDR